MPDEIRLELLTKAMTESLKLKIKTDKKKNPTEKNWTYAELEEAIKKHAVDPIDPTELARRYIKPFGGNIDNALEKIEDHLESLSHATQGSNIGNIDADRKKTAQEMYKKKR